MPNPDEVASVHVIRFSHLDVEPRSVTIPFFGTAHSAAAARRVRHAPTAALLHQFREVALHARPTRVAHYEQPLFAWQ